jgi:Rrf2 family protein
MRLKCASLYALQALAHLAAAGGGRPVAAPAIARARGIPAQFLRKVLQALASAHLLRSHKGPGGGYLLARPAEGITLLEVVEAVDGPLRGRVPRAAGSRDPLDARLLEVCAAAAGRVRRRLGRVRLADLAGKR